MRVEIIRRKVKDFRAGIPGMVSILVFDRGKNLLLYGESDDIVSPLGDISFCYVRLAHKLEKAHRSRKNTIGKSLKCLNIVSARMMVSMRALSEKHIVVGECMSEKGVGLFVAGVWSLNKIFREEQP